MPSLGTVCPWPSSLRHVIRSMQILAKWHAQEASVAIRYQRGQAYHTREAGRSAGMYRQSNNSRRNLCQLAYLILLAEEWGAIVLYFELILMFHVHWFSTRLHSTKVMSWCLTLRPCKGLFVYLCMADWFLKFRSICNLVVLKTIFYSQMCSVFTILRHKIYNN